jgi:hypothetical protein
VDWVVAPPHIELASKENFVVQGMIQADEPSGIGRICHYYENPERTLLWVPPTSGKYRMSLYSDNVDATAGVMNLVCGGGILGCVYDFEPDEFEAIAGQPYTFVIETHDTCYFELSVELLPPECLLVELSGPEATWDGMTEGPSEYSSECGGEDSSDRAWLFIPDVTGTYRLDTAGSEFDTLVYVIEGECWGPVVGCNAAQLEIELQADQHYTIVVDGQGGQSGYYEFSLQLL